MKHVIEGEYSAYYGFRKDDIDKFNVRPASLDEKCESITYIKKNLLSRLAFALFGVFIGLIIYFTEPYENFAYVCLYFVFGILFVVIPFFIEYNRVSKNMFIVEAVILSKKRARHKVHYNCREMDLVLLEIGSTKCDYITLCWAGLDELKLDENTPVVLKCYKDSDDNYPFLHIHTDTPRDIR